jgi:hypothetical protein
LKPIIAYTPFKNFNDGNFVLVRSHDLDLVMLWTKRAEGDVIKDNDIEYFKVVRVQWWVLVKKRSNIDEQHLYEDCWNGKWKRNVVDLKQWLDVSTFFFSFPT